LRIAEAETGSVINKQSFRMNESYELTATRTRDWPLFFIPLFVHFRFIFSIVRDCVRNVCFKFVRADLVS